MTSDTQARASEPAAVVAAAVGGDEAAFATLSERHRRELHVHCYRMLGSLHDAEDLVQETYLRAWRRRETFRLEGDWSFRAWLYRIATNACLDALKHRPARVLPHQLSPPADPTAPPLAPVDLPWLQPYPDQLLDGIAPRDQEPDAIVVARETIELTFLATIQLLPPRQRAVLILRDVLGWPARDTATALAISVASANSALQRARATLREHLPEGRLQWPGAQTPTAHERAVVRRYMEAMERADVAAVAALLHEDTRATMPPYPMWFAGRDAIVTAMIPGFDPAGPQYMGDWLMVPVAANRLPGAAAYLRAPGDDTWRAFGIDVLRVEGDQIVEITAFHDTAFPAFGLPPTR